MKPELIKIMLFTAILWCIVLSSCSNTPATGKPTYSEFLSKETVASENTNEVYSIADPANILFHDPVKLSVVTIDDCEYLIGSAGCHDMGNMFCHKGDCHNPVHHQNVDLMEEWQTLSTDSSKPDLVVAWKDDKGVVHLSFDN